MNSHRFILSRRVLGATALSLCISASLALAQTSGSSSGSTGSNNSSANYSGSSSSDSANRNSTGSYGSSSTDSSRDHSMSSASSSSSDKLSWGDKRFVTKAADDGQSEVQIAQLAAQKATNPDVKQFAEQMVRDHTAVNEELMGIASSKNVKIDKDEGKDRMYNKLNKKSGEEFDREFVAHMVDEHEKDIKLFEKASNDAKDSEIRNFASKHLADLRHHLEIVQGLQQSVMPTGRSDNSSGRTMSKSHHSSNASSSNGTSSGTDSSNSTGTYGTSSSDASKTSTSGAETPRSSSSTR